MKRFAARHNGFTVLEILVATAVLAILLVLILQVTSQTSQTLRQVTGQVDAFQSARAAFDDINRTLSQATLNTYWDYQNDSSGNPTAYKRASDLHFVVKPAGDSEAGLYFQAPLAISSNSTTEVSGLLNAVGYWVEFGPDNWKPDGLGENRSRFRLMQAVQNSEDLDTMRTTNDSWVADVRGQGRPLANNVIALVALPKWSAAEDSTGTDLNPLSPNFSYDSRNGTLEQLAQLPPQVQVTMIAIDERDAVRLGANLENKINTALKDKFVLASSFDDDLNDVRNKLAEDNISNQVFSTSVPLRESKWSKTR